MARASAGATATASTTASVHSVDNLINGDRKGPGIWGDNSPWSYPDWIQVNFAKAETINATAIFSVQDAYPNVVEPTTRN